MAGGYTGKMLRVDLTNKKVSEVKLDDELFRKFGGGVGVGVKLMYDEVPPGVKATDPENRLIFMTGPFTGSRVQSPSNWQTITQNAITGCNITVANSHGFFGARLKFAGFDGIIVQGRAEKPVYLWVHDGECEIRDASRIWGKMDAFETEDAIRAELGQERASIASIGPAGEHMAASAMVQSDKGHIASHGNPGIVMGSKYLKAVAAYGSRSQIPVANPEAYSELAKKWRDDSMISAQFTHTWGTGGNISWIHEAGQLPTRNFTTGVFPGWEKITGQHLRTTHELKRNPCFGCSIAHAHMMKITEGPYTGFQCEEPEYEDLSNLGSNLGIGDIGAISWLTDYTDRLGYDANWAGSIVGWAMEAYEKGILTREMLGGLEMKWGDEKAAAELLRKIAYREGIGDTLALGLKEGPMRIGGEKAAAFAVHFKGETNHAHDSRASWGQFLGLCVSSAGPRWEVGSFDTRPDLDLGFDKPTGRYQTEGKAEQAGKAGNKKLFTDSLGICNFGAVSLDTETKAYTALTGLPLTKEEALKIGERIANMERAFNVRHGFRPEMDLDVSPRLLEPPPDGGAQGRTIAPHLERLIKEFNQYMDWDWQTGKPSKSKLEQLGLDDVARDLWGK